jgi:hypothetical protein
MKDNRPREYNWIPCGGHRLTVSRASNLAGRDAAAAEWCFPLNGAASFPE